MIERDSASAIRHRIQSGHLSAVEVWEHHHQRAVEVEPRLQAFVDLDAFAVAGRAHAEAIDRRRDRGEPLGPLAGVPVAVKDNLAVAGQALGCGSRHLADYVAPSHATAVARLLDADALILGKTRLDEFAMGSSCETSAHGPTHNPWNVDRVPGGSSGGSAAAVAAGVPLALGSDSGGSVRQPAAYCGVVGLRPTYGHVSRRGLVGFAPSFDQVGPMAANVDDAARLFSVIASHDPADATSARRSAPSLPDLGAAREASIAGLRIGVPRELDLDRLPSDVAGDFQAAVDRLIALGGQVVPVDIPDFDAAAPCYHLLAAAEASTTLGRFDGVRYGVQEPGETLEALHTDSRSAGFGPEVQRRLLLGTFALAADNADAYERRARSVRRTLSRRLHHALGTVDIVVTPTAPSAAFRMAEHRDDPVALHSTDTFTAPASLAGLPAITVPSGLDADGMPLGLQGIARAFDEATLIRMGRAFEQATRFPQCPARLELAA